MFMSNSKKFHKRTFINNPYLYMLSVFLLIGSICYTVFMIYACYIGPNRLFDSFLQSFEQPPEFFKFILLIVIPIVPILLVVIIDRYEYLGIVKIADDYLELCALGLTRRLYYQEILHLGIDCDIVGGKRQFWIYFSRVPIPMEYYHRITRLKYTKNTFRVKYSRKVYESFLHYLPSKLSKELGKQYSVILLYGKDMED